MKNVFLALKQKNDSVGREMYINIKRKCAAVKTKGKLRDLGNHFFSNPKAGIIKAGSVWGDKIGSERWEVFQ